MKKKSFILSLTYFFAFIFLLNISSTVCAVNANASESKTYSINVPYEYPVLPGTNEWKNLDSHTKKIEVCQIPESILKNMSTSSLLKTVLNYPLMVDMLAYDSPGMGYISIFQSFNGLRELSKREDFLFELNNYKNITSQQYTYSNRATLKSVYIYVIENFITDEYTKLMNTQNERSSSIAITTPKGTTFYAKYNQTWADHGITTESIAAEEDANLRLTYPNAVKIGPIAPAYNCHSYAWYAASTANKVWIDNPGPYMADGSYTHIPSAQAGCRVYMANNNNPIHSGIVFTTSYGSANRIGIRSKWGALGLYEHSLHDNPYYGQSSTITYWK